MEYKEVIKGFKRMCDSYTDCDKCPLVKVDCCNEFLHTDPDKAEEIIAEWLELHPAKTNGDVLLEAIRPLFPGLVKDFDSLDFSSACVFVVCPEHGNCKLCEYKDYWQKEYTGGK